METEFLADRVVQTCCPYALPPRLLMRRRRQSLRTRCTLWSAAFFVLRQLDCGERPRGPSGLAVASVPVAPLGYHVELVEPLGLCAGFSSDSRSSRMPLFFQCSLAPFSLLSFSGSWDVLAGALDGVLWVSEVLGIDLRYFFVLFL